MGITRHSVSGYFPVVPPAREIARKCATQLSASLPNISESQMLDFFLAHAYTLAGVSVHNPMNSRGSVKILWIVFVFGVLAIVAPWPSRAQFELIHSTKMDKHIQKILDQYNVAFAGAVKSNWWCMVDSKPAAYHLEGGEVTLKFTLHSTGQVTDMKIAKRSVFMNDALLCEEAVSNGVPYQTWSEEILKALGTNAMGVEYIFNY